MTLEPVNVARIVYKGMAHLNCTKMDMLHMTPREFLVLWDEYLADHGKARSRVCSIDDLP